MNKFTIIATLVASMVLAEEHLDMDLEVDVEDVVAEELSPVEHVHQDKPFKMDQETFYTTVIDSETKEVLGSKPWFIEYYAPWCGHC